MPILSAQTDLTHDSGLREHSTDFGEWSARVFCVCVPYA